MNMPRGDSSCFWLSIRIHTLLGSKSSVLPPANVGGPPVASWRVRLTDRAIERVCSPANAFLVTRASTVLAKEGFVVAYRSARPANLNVVPVSAPVVHTGAVQQQLRTNGDHGDERSGGQRGVVAGWRKFSRSLTYLYETRTVSRRRYPLHADVDPSEKHRVATYRPNKPFWYSVAR